jgi:hypothetical protein
LEVGLDKEEKMENILAVSYLADPYFHLKTLQFQRMSLLPTLLVATWPVATFMFLSIDGTVSNIGDREN